jgi:hypothetical protein
LFPGLGAGAGFGAGCDDRLKAELRSFLGIIGKEALGAGRGGDIGATAGAGAVDAHPPKSSELNRSAGMFAAGFGTGAGAGAGGDVAAGL